MVLPGFNTDFTHNGQVYHAQTEDNGVSNPVVVTLLYLRGAILASKRSSYANLLEHDNCQQEVMELMKEQHRTIMREVLSGKYEGATAQTPEETAAPRASQESSAAEEAAIAAVVDDLDRQIMEYLESLGRQSGLT